jgi:hypothetical protein
MSEHDPSTATIERELAAIEDALAGGVATSDEPSARELQELALALRAEAPEPDAEFARELRTRAKAGFPPAPGSLAAAGASLRERLRPAKLRRALPAMGVIAAILIPIVLVASLAGSPNTTDDGGGDAGGGGGAVRADDGGGSAAPEASKSAPPGGSAPATVSPGPPPQRFAPGQSNRKIERSIGLELEAPVDEMQRVADQLTNVTNRHGGFVLSSSLSTGDEGAGGDFELRIPSNRLRPALRDLSSLATVRSQSQSGRDVTREHVTTRDRLQAAQAERLSLLRRLENADTDEQAEAIRTRLDLVSAEINGLRAQLRDLRLRTDYAVVTVTLLAAENSNEEGTGGAGSFDDALGDAGDLLAGTAGILIRVLAVALPLALIAGLGWLIGAALRRRRRESALA